MSNVIGSTPFNFDGDYNNLTNKPTIPPAYSLPIASNATLGGVKVNGNNLSIDSNTGVLSATNTEYTEGDGIDIDSNNTISLDIAQASVIGGVKVNGNNLSIDSSTGVLSATNTEYTEGDGIDIDSNNTISLDIAQASVIGGVKVNGNNLSIDSSTGVLSATVPTQTSELTNNSNFITASSNINNTLIQTTRQEIIGDTQPQLYIRPSATSGRDATLTLEGRRNNNSNINTTYLKFTNFDDNDGANGSTAIVGMICGAVSNAADNTGRLRFYTSSTGSNAALCLSLDSDNSATFYGNVTFSNTPKDSSNYSYITTNSTNTLLNKSFTYDSISDPPNLFDGDYDTLTNKPNLAVFALDASLVELSNNVFDGDYDNLTNKPNLAVFALDASLVELSNNVFDGDYDNLTNKPNLAVFALDASLVELSNNVFDGDYDNLTNKPNLAVFALDASLVELSNNVFDGDYDNLTNKPDLFDGDYDTLTNKPNLAVFALDASLVELSNNVFDGDYDNLTNKPNLAVFALDASLVELSNNVFDGDYDNLTNKPDLFDGDYDTLTNKPNLAVFALDASLVELSNNVFDGDYDNLTNKPNLAVFALDASLVELSNNVFDGDYDNLTNKPNLAVFALDASLVELSNNVFDGDYDNLTNKPDLFDGDYDTLTNKPDLFDGDYDTLTNKPSLAVFALDASLVELSNNVFDGDYDNLTNKPSLAVFALDASLVELSNNVFDGDYDNLTNKPSLAVFALDASLVELSNNVFDGDYDNLTNKPSLAVFALDASLVELSNNVIQNLTSYSQPDAITLGSTDNTITLKTNSLTRLTINNDGKIGIGTTPPLTPLTIKSAGVVPSDADIQTSNAGYKSHLLIMDQTAYDGVNNGGSILFGGLVGATATGYWAKISGEKAFTTIGGSKAGVLKFWTRYGASGDPLERMVIDRDGDVGIGVTSPTEKLDVDGNINTTGSYKINGTALATEDLTNNSGFITASASNTLTNKLRIEYDVSAPFVNSDEVNLLVTNVTSNTEDAAITIRGSRNGTTTAKQSQLRFENTDDNPSPTKIRTLGAICGVVTDAVANIGSLKFYTFSNGSSENVCMEMKSTNDIAISQSATIGSNLTVTGTVTTGGLTFTNDDGGTTTISNMLESINSISATLNGYGDAVDKDTTSVVSSGSADLVTSGGVYTAIRNITISSTRQVVGTFNKHVDVDTDITGGVPYIVWDTTVSNSNGITHTSGSVVPNNSLFNVIETGLYIFNILIPLENKNASGRSYVGCDIQVYTGSSLSSRGGQFMTHPISTVYVRGNAGTTNTSLISGTVTIHLEAGKQFEFMGRTVYQTNTNCRVECQNGTSVKIERIVYSQTVVSP